MIIPMWSRFLHVFRDPVVRGKSDPLEIKSLSPMRSVISQNADPFPKGLSLSFVSTLVVIYYP